MCTNPRGRGLRRDGARDPGELTERQSNLVQIITRSSDALLTIINDILDFSKIEAGAIELDTAAFNLRDAIGDVTSLLRLTAEEKGLEILVDYPEHLPNLFIGDVGRIRQIVTNLVGNGIKFTEKGHVSISVDVEPGSERQKNVRIAVQDTGMGISPENHDAIFEQFMQADNSKTRAHGGTGLGLAISRRFATLMGGSVTVQSEPGQDSIFFLDVVLPSALIEEDGFEREMPIAPTGLAHAG